MPAGRDDGRSLNKFYLSSNTARDCFVSVLSDEDETSEQEISDYIKYHAPSLFQKLGGLPIKSSDIPQNLDSKFTLKHSSHPQNRGTKIATTVSGAIHQKGSLRNQSHEYGPQSLSASTTTLLESTRDRIEQKLENGYSLYRRRYDTRGGHPVCEFALCTNRGLDAYTCEMMVVEFDSLAYINLTPAFPIRNEYFCNQCYQSIIPSIYSNMGRQYSSLHFDGVDHHTILQTANRLYLPSDLLSDKLDKFIDVQSSEDHAFNYPSNSSKAKFLRAQTQKGIDESLMEVAKYQKARHHGLNTKCRSEHDTTEDGNLLITRPYYMEPKNQRYKKQGLTRNEFTKDLRMRKALIDGKDLTASPKDTPLLSPLKTVCKEDRICHCREPDDGTEILRCSANFCPIGWFHLRCTDLDYVPSITQSYHCYYCRDDSDGSGIESLPMIALHQSSVEPETYSPVLLHLAETIDDRQYSQKVACWSAVESVEDGSDNLSEHATSHQVRGTENLDYGYLASDELESADELRQQDDSDLSTLTSTSFREMRSKQNPSPDPTRCLTPQPVELTPPRTPRPAPTPQYVSSKPWGTPVNVSTKSVMRCIDLSIPQSPSPMRKRKLNEIECDMHEISLEISESEEEGELVPLMLEL